MNIPVRYLLDTNIISEARRSHMDKRVEAFLSRSRADSLFLSILTLGELRKGVALKRKTDPTTADALGAWVAELEETFADRIVNIDAAVAKLWGELSSDRSRPVIDTLIGATALVHGMVLVTRNTKDLAGLDVALLDPFAE